MHDPFDRPHFAAGVELDGPYRPTPAQQAQRLRAVLARLWQWLMS